MLDRVMQEMAERSPGCLGAALVGMDGMTLVRVERPGGPDLDLCAAEYSTLLRRVDAMPSHQGAGRLRGLVALAERCHLLAERVTEDYFLLLAASPEGSLGRCRWEMRRAALALEADLR